MGWQFARGRTRGLSVPGRYAARCALRRSRPAVSAVTEEHVGGAERLLGRVPGPAADLRQAGRVVLGLPRRPPRRARGRGAPPARPRQAALSTRLSARAFAPRTEALHGQELDLARPAVIAGGDRGHERLLTHCAAAPLARAVPAQVGVVHLDPAVETLLTL